MSSVLPLAGLATGVLMGFTGVGSGALTAPLLLFLGVNPAVVVGSDIAFGLVTKLFGGALHIKHRTIDWSWVRRLAYGSIPGVLIGSAIVSRVAHSPELLRTLVGFVLVITAGAAMGLGILRIRNPAILSTERQPAAALVAGIGFVIGILVGATSVGSGSLVDIALLLFSGLAGARLVGTGLAHAVLLSAVASLAHWNMGTIQPGIVLPLLAGSIPGIMFGTWGARRTSPGQLRWVVTALVFISGATLLSQVPLK